MTTYPPEPDSQARANSQRSALANAVVHIYAKHYGRGPTKACAYLHDDFAMVVLEDVYTPAEHTLMAAGKFEHVMNMRTTFQTVMKKEFVEATEEITGRTVRGFVSQTIETPEVSVELFLLEPEARADGDRDG